MISRRTTGSVELVHAFDDQMPTGVTVSDDGRVFVCYPRWGDDVRFTVAELRDGEEVPYPNADVNVFDADRAGESLVSVQSVVVDPAGRLWLLDTGSVELGPVFPEGPKLVCVDLERDAIVRTIHVPPETALERTYLNDIRFALRRGDEGMAFITDSSDEGPNAIIVVDLGTGRSWRKLHDHPSTRPVDGHVAVIEGQAVEGLAEGADADDTVIDHGEKGASDGLETDAEGRLYATNYEHGAILRRTPDGEWETVAHQPEMIFVDTLAVAADGFLYFTNNQLHRQPDYQGGEDRREPPYSVMRTPIDGTPVRLAH